MIKRINYPQINPKAIEGIAALSKHITSIDEKLRALVALRVSQINGCVYCVDLHAQQARAAGESQRRLDCLAAWHECSFFDDRERAALAWAEAVTRLPEMHAPDKEYEELKKYFSEREIVDLTLIVSLMNTWNRIAVSFRRIPDARTYGSASAIA